MKTLLHCFLTALLCSIIQIAFAQQQGAYLLQNGASAGGAPSVIELDNNQTLLVGYSSFGYDSSYVTMIWLDENLAVTQHKEFRLFLPLNFVFHAVKCADEILIGTLEYSTFGSPISIIRTDLSGNILRYDLSFNNPQFQEKIKQLVGNDNGSFTGYTSKSGFVGSMYRIDGNLSDTIYHTKKILPAIANDYFRPYNSCDVDGNGLHLLTGGTNDFAASNINAFLLKLDSTMIHWSKSYDYGATSNEEAYNIIPLDNGNFAFVGQTFDSANNTIAGVVTVADASGENVWSKKITSSAGGIYVSAVVETAGGDLLIFGNNSSYEGIQIKLNSTGDVIWKKKLTGINYLGFSNAIRQSNDQILALGVSGGFLLTQLDEEGNGCQWIDDDALEISDVTPTVTNISFTYSPDVISFTPRQVLPRDLSTSSSTICMTTNLAEENIPSQRIHVYPNPTEDLCVLTSNTQEIEHYTLTDAFGKTLLQGQFRNQTTLSIGEFPRGVYLLNVKHDSDQEVIKLVH